MKTINKNTCHYPAGLDNPEKGNSHFTRYSGQARVGQNKKAFTLVELIIVITILAILATIAFISFQNFTKDARDGNRQTTLSSLQKGLELYTIKTGNYPTPEGTIFTGSFNSTPLAFVGNIGESISRVINMSKPPLDPVTEKPYMYGVSYDNKYYEIGATLETLTAKVVGNYKGLIKRDDTLYNPKGIIFVGTPGEEKDLEALTYYVTDEQKNLPYKINATTTLTGGTSKTSTGMLIQTIKDEWNNTLSGTISETLGVSLDVVGVMVFGEKEYFSSVKDGGSTGNGGNQTPPVEVIQNVPTFLQLCTGTPTTGEIHYTDNSGIKLANESDLTCNTKTDGTNNGGHIVVCDGLSTGYVLQACNMGATAVGATNTTTAYGNYYQWGNNWGGSSSATTTTTKATCSSTESSTSYSNFVTGSSDWCSSQTDNIWGNTTNTSLARKGPCPTDYHVPSQPEWEAVITAWGGGTNGTKLSNALKLPFAGLRYRNAGSMYSQGGNGYYWSSSPNGADAYSLNFNSSDVTPSNNLGRAYGFSVRCFKN